MGCELATNAAFYDCLGIFVFAFVIIVSILQLNSKKKLPNWVYYLLLGVGVASLIVDSFMVYFNFVR